MPQLMKLNVKWEFFAWINHLHHVKKCWCLGGEKLPSKEGHLVPKLHHIPHSMKMNVKWEAFVGMNHPLCEEMWAPRRRGSTLKKGHLLWTPRCTSHASLNIAECQVRSLCIDEPSTCEEAWTPRKRGLSRLNPRLHYMPHLMKSTVWRRVGTPREVDLPSKWGALARTSKHTSHTSLDKAERQVRTFA